MKKLILILSSFVFFVYSSESFSIKDITQIKVGTRYCVQHDTIDFKWCTLPFGDSISNATKLGNMMLIKQASMGGSTYFDKCIFNNTVSCDNSRYVSGIAYYPVMDREPSYGFAILAGNGDIYFIWPFTQAYTSYGVFPPAINQSIHTYVVKGKLLDNNQTVRLDSYGHLRQYVRVFPHPGDIDGLNNRVRMLEYEEPVYLQVTKEVVFNY